MAYKSYNLRNFKKCFGLIEDIARQTETRYIDFAYGYAYATIRERAKSRSITKHQETALFELADDAAIAARSVAAAREAAKKAKTEETTAS